MLEVDALDASIAGTRVLRGASIEVPDRQTVGLVGRNGAGKTTLMRAVMGLIGPSRGRIVLGGTDITGAPPHARAPAGVGYMPEDRRLISEFTVEENILLPLHAINAPIDRARLDWIYGLLPEIARYSDRAALALSGGQQKLVALARAMIVGRNLLLLDEPFEGVAPVLARRLAEVIATLRDEGLSVLLSESDHVHSADLLDRLYVIERGEVARRQNQKEETP